MFRRRSTGHRHSKTATTNLLRRSFSVGPVREPRGQHGDEDDDVNNSAPAVLEVEKKVRFGKKKKAITKVVVPPGSSEYRDPALWWSSDEMYTRLRVDCHLALHCQEAGSYAVRCNSARTGTCADPVIAKALLDDDSSSADEREVSKLQHAVLCNLRPGLLCFRGMETVGQERSDLIQAHTRRVVVAQRSCSGQQELAEIAEASTLSSRCWARLLALGDELLVKVSVDDEESKEESNDNICFDLQASASVDDEESKEKSNDNICFDLQTSAARGQPVEVDV